MHRIVGFGVIHEVAKQWMTIEIPLSISSRGVNQKEEEWVQTN